MIYLFEESGNKKVTAFVFGGVAVNADTFLHEFKDDKYVFFWDSGFFDK